MTQNFSLDACDASTRNRSFYGCIRHHFCLATKTAVYFPHGCNATIRVYFLRGCVYDRQRPKSVSDGHPRTGRLKRIFCIFVCARSWRILQRPFFVCLGLVLPFRLSHPSCYGLKAHTDPLSGVFWRILRKEKLHVLTGPLGKIINFVPASIWVYQNPYHGYKPSPRHKIAPLTAVRNALPAKSGCIQGTLLSHRTSLAVYDKEPRPFWQRPSA